MTEEVERSKDQTTILIHTSVKLVTRGNYPHTRKDLHFNPHEREARDELNPTLFTVSTLF